MEPETEAELRERGKELRARHDDAVIADLIGEIRASDAETAAQTAEILEIMVDSGS